MQRRWWLMEAVVVVVVVLLTALGADLAVQRAIAVALARTGERLRSPEQVLVAAHDAVWWFGFGAAALLTGALLGRLWAGARGIAVPWLLPAAIAAAGLGLSLQLGFGDPLRGPRWPGPTFAEGFAIGGVIGGLLLAVPLDLERVLVRVRWTLLFGIVGTFAALTLFGSGPISSDTRINLGPIQPLELVKVAFVLYTGVFFGRRATAIRYQRDLLLRGWLQLPRWRLLLPAVLVLLILFCGLFAVRDLGPILILGLTWLALITVVTRSPSWPALAIAIVAAAVGIVVSYPDMVGSSSLSVRTAMWLDPWHNALPGGDQLASSRWAIASGGLFGQGLGRGFVGALPAGQTDLVLAYLAEELGLLGVWLYTGLLSLIVLSGVWVAANSRTAERSLVVIGLVSLLFAQWFVIFCGTTGLLPLTGVVVPLLSAGRTSMVSFVVLISLISALARDGRVRVLTDELRQLRIGVLALGTAMGLLFAAAAVVVLWEGVVIGPSTTAQGVVTTLADGTVNHRHDRRIEAIVAAVPRGRLLDRNGSVLAEDGPDGRRIRSLGTALGTLLGPDDPVVLRQPWMLERIHDEVLRGYPELPDGPAVWLAISESGQQRLLFVVRSRTERDDDRERALQLAGGDVVRLLPLPAPDLRSLVPALHTSPERRAWAITSAVGTADDRAVRLTLDATLQQFAAEVLKAAAAKGIAAAAVVLDVDTGEVLVRAQFPDVELSNAAWIDRVVVSDPVFTGVYGPYNDMTAERGIFQAGSVGKLVTAIAAVRSGLATVGEGCEMQSEALYACVGRDNRGPYFQLPGWKQSIHDYYKDQPHGAVDLSEAIAVSCNVTFGQLGLKLGPEPFVDLVAGGLEVGWSDTFRPGQAGSSALAQTGFGQGATALSVSQAARMAALIGAGGVYRKCPASMALGAPCEQRRLHDEPDALGVVLSGMSGVMERGTGVHLMDIEGVRVYGKTGTADSLGLLDEVPYGIERGARGLRPHSWFVAVAEPDGNLPCALLAPDRLAIAVVVPRSGTGASVAGPAAIEILHKAHELGYLGGNL